LALAPAAGWAQGLGGSGLNSGGLDVGRENPIVPLPISSPRPELGGFYTALQFSMLRQSRNLGNQVIAVRGLRDLDGSIQRDLGGAFIIPPGGGAPVFVPGAPGVPGAFLGSGAPALNVNQLNQSNSYTPGYEMILGYRFQDGTAFEWRWKHIATARFSVGADIIPPGFAVGPNLLDTFLFAPVFNFPNNFAGQAQELSLGNPGAAYGIWNAAASMRISFEQRYDQSDWGTRVPLRADDISRTSVLTGARFAWIWERFKWTTVSQDFNGLAGPADMAIYSNIVSNRMYGPYLGFEHEVFLGWGVAIGFRSDLAAMLDIVKQRARYELGDKSASTKFSVTDYTFAPMYNGELNLTWYPVQGLQLRFGWQMMAVMNTVNAPAPVAFNFGNLDGVWQRRAIRYLDGLNAGVALNW
jgi:hypothetical protein